MACARVAALPFFSLFAPQIPGMFRCNDPSGSYNQPDWDPQRPHTCYLVPSHTLGRQAEEAISHS
jgi:hypothetical protein